MSIDREEIIRRAAKITSLRGNIASLQKELETAESEFDHLLGTPTPARLRPIGGELALAGVEDKSLNQQIIDIIDSGPPEENLDAETVLSGLPDGTNVTSVRSALARLADQGRIRRTTRGRYGKNIVDELQPSA